MASENQTVIPEALKGVSQEVLEQALRVRRAEERMADLRKNLSVVKGELSSATSLEELYRLCAGFVSKVNNARQILGTTMKAKHGKKQSK